MIVKTKNHKTLLDKAVDEKQPFEKDTFWTTIRLKGGYELCFTPSEWKAIIKK